VLGGCLLACVCCDVGRDRGTHEALSKYRNIICLYVI
jgi:hypothetical protein